jgi:hypothetical protein
VDESEYRDSISTELSNIEESAMWSSQGQFEQAKLWRATHLILGVPAAALAAVAGATALASTTGRITAGVIALVAAGLGAVASSLDAAGRAEAAQTAGNRYLALQTDARVAREVDLASQDAERNRQTLQELMARRDEINAEASVISKFAYRRARRNIESGGQTYGQDQLSRPGT